MSTYSSFELEVQHLSSPDDFSKNRDKLKDLRVSSYETFSSLLRNGGNIESSIKVADEIFKMSASTQLRESDILELSNKFRLIIGLIDKN